ncbi:MAG: enoyl-CoA hydratase/isomerase family protein [Desulfobacterales bacterium]|nr:MAG: enoyl-CoA hydratase/isomerase family protein [Desulfobacterales bacterium]
MTELKNLKFEKADGVARITLNRPKFNMMNIEMMNELNGLLEELLTDNDLKCVAVNAEGKHFCTGVEVADHKPAKVDDMIATFNRIFELTEQLEVPIIAVVQGYCLGGGMELAIACDVIVAGQGAQFGQPEIKVGFFPPYAAMRLPQLVGPARAIEICTTGKFYSAEEARIMGMVGYVVDDDQLGEAAAKMIKDIQNNSPLIIRLNKRAVKQHLGLSFKPALDGVSDLFLNTLMKTEDTLEGIASYEEKRKPEWKNK